MEDSTIHGKLRFTAPLKIFVKNRKFLFLLFSAVLFFFLLFLDYPGPTGQKRSAAEYSSLLNEKITHTISTLKTEGMDIVQKIKKHGISYLSSEDLPYETDFTVFNEKGGFIAGSGALVSPPDWIKQKILHTETFIYSNAVASYLAVVLPAVFKREKYLIIASARLERYYALKNNYDDKSTLFSEIEAEYGVLYSLASKNTNTDSVQLNDENGKKIATSGVLKDEGNAVTGEVFRMILRALIFIAAIFLLFVSIHLTLKEWLRIGGQERKGAIPVYLFFLFSFAVLFRFLLLFIEPAQFLSLTKFDDPSNFSSIFGGGIAKSPINFLLTAFIGALFSFYLLLIRIKRKLKPASGRVSAFIQYAVFAVLSVPAVRVLAAVDRSVVYDSSLRYFFGDSILPGKEIIIMNVAIIMAAFTFLVPAILILEVSVKRSIEFVFGSLSHSQFSYQKIFSTGALLAAMPVFIYFFIKEPDLFSTLPLVIIVFVLLSAVWFIDRANTTLASSFLVIAFIASVVSIVLLSKFNEELEKNSLKKIAMEINRPTDTFLRFLVQQSLSVFINQNISPAENKMATDGLAFRVWSASILNGEVYPFKISVYQGKELKDRFSPFGISILSGFDDSPDTSLNDLKIHEKSVHNGKIISGTAPFAESEKGRFFAVVTLLKRNFQVPGAGIPEFIKPETNPVNDVIDLRRISIFKFAADSLEGSYGELQLPESTLYSINKAVSNGAVETLERTVIQGEEVTLYYYAPPGTEKRNLTVLVLKDKDPARILFNFFKLFVLHSIFIILLFLVITFTSAAKLKPLLFRFQTQLILSFLIISTIPIVALAVFNRGNQASIEEKNRHMSLKTRIDRVYEILEDSSFGMQQGVSSGIPFSLYINGVLVMSSPTETKTVFIPKVLLIPNSENHAIPIADNFMQQRFDNYDYYTLSRSWVRGKDVRTILVNDISGESERSALRLEFDVFLFGVYSFAVILTLILATVIAGRISSPILKLTRAANSVAMGNLDYEIKSKGKGKGEIGDLIRGFKFMLEEIKKNQDEIALLERDAAWKEMAKQVAHEVKNPLTPMKLSVQHLLSAAKDNNTLDPLTEKVLNSLLKQIEILNQTASEFSKSAKMPGFETVKINALELTKEVANLYTGSPLTIKLTAPEKEPFIPGDESYFKRAMINMIRNSLQAGADKVNITVSEFNNFWVFEISDNGSGIPPELRDKIFEINFTTKQTGTGLGLKLTKRFVESVGGSIELTDQKVGTAFRLKFPAFKEET